MLEGDLHYRKKEKLEQIKCTEYVEKESSLE